VVDCYFEMPIETEGMGLEDLPKLEVRMRGVMLGHLTKKTHKE